MKGSKENLEKLVSDPKDQGHNIYSEAKLTSPVFSPLTVGIGNGIGQGQPVINLIHYIQLCTNASLDVAIRLGEGGARFIGNLTAIAAIQAQIFPIRKVVQLK